MSPNSFPSINSLLNSPTKPYQQQSPYSETHPKAEERSPGPITTLMSIPSVHQPGTAHLSYLGPVEPNLPSEIEFGDTNMNLQQLPDAYSGGPYYENFDPIVEDNMHPQSLSHSFTDSQSLLASSHFAFVASLVKICTTAVLKHYHSLLPAPSVYIQVQQNLPQLPLSAAMKIMNPQETPQTALLCAEAVEVGRALDSNLSLTAVLDLISHATRGGESASQSEQLLSESQHAARMAPLWDLASELLDKLSKIAQGATLHPLIFYSTPHTAQAFCKKLDDEEAMRHVRSVIPDLCLDVMLANGEWN